ncbi:MAG: 2-amino-4-hydroxy-6-hydroxymethyldihydropteridine diphosphokinase [Rhodospirillales bacterium]|nr:2-amino-4-hydroxy-6-hydroxymethyldihydropteridine diphosphokinase [Rhodospirillales bacterium]
MILIGLGANLPGRFGSPRAALDAAREGLGPLGLSAVSSVWVSAPVPVSGQPWYFNQVVRLDTDLGSHAVLDALLALETRLGRLRSVPNAPRVMDLDLLCHGSCVCDDPDLTLPHPRMHLRAFVLFPLKEIAPCWVHPVSGRSVSDLIAALEPGQEIRRDPS